MNFLAHAYLSGNDKKILTGNFIGDFVKGKQALNQFEPQIIKGVVFHRAIDSFTDSHPVVRESKNRLRTGYGHYAGVIVDVFYDHFLATHWKDLHPQTLADFETATYQTLQSFSDILPERFKTMLPYMIKGKWLTGYANISGIHGALSGMASRTTFNSKMELASTDLKKHYEKFRNEFERFFPDLKSFSDQWMEKNL